MLLFNPRTYRGQHPDQRTDDMLQAVVDWFEAKGLKSLKQDWHDKTWNHDFVDFMKSRQVLATLTPREERVLRLRFGIGEETSSTLEEVGHEFDVTRERIRQIEAKALAKLRHPSLSDRLANFWKG